MFILTDSDGKRWKVTTRGAYLTCRSAKIARGWQQAHADRERAAGRPTVADAIERMTFVRWGYEIDGCLENTVWLNAAEWKATHRK